MSCNFLVTGRNLQVDVLRILDSYDSPHHVSFVTKAFLATSGK